jgi:hypothetical protein
MRRNDDEIIRTIHAIKMHMIETNEAQLYANFVQFAVSALEHLKTEAIRAAAQQSRDAPEWGATRWNDSTVRKEFEAELGRIDAAIAFLQTRDQ